mgnify:CR=1 FL=1
MPNGEVMKYNHILPDYDVIESKETEEIAGFKCHKAILKFKDGSTPQEVWYTKEINFTNPNWSNAYYKVDGVLMDYTLKKFGLELHFVASNVTESSIDDNTFKVIPEYKKISPLALEAMFKELE